MALCLFLPLTIVFNIQSEMSFKQIQYNNAVDTSVDDALADAKVEYDSGKELFINKDSVKDCFFKSLYSSFGIQDDKNKQELVKIYVPVMLFTEKDGYYIYHMDEFKDSTGASRIVSNWTEKRKYTFNDTKNNLLINFTLGNDISVYDKASKEKIEGDYRDIRIMYPDIDYFQSDEDFENTRRTCITEHLKEDMSLFINKHNRIASAYGIRYNFELPNIEKNDWYRTIDDTGIMVIFQGYPFGDKANGYYNKYAVGSARLKKESLYYIVEEDGTKYYHRADCSKISPDTQAEVYYSRKECAQQGAFPDSCCD